MKAKASVQLAGATFYTGYAAAVAETAYRDAGTELVVTAVKDGVHGSNSLHYSGNAIDLRTRGLTRKQGAKILGFDIVDERGKSGAPHIHVEFQLKPRESFLQIVS